MCSNNTDPARGPRDSRGWQAIDIFLFANGQQYSPPRKYHLQIDELDDWENTLSVIATAHYGPRYNVIELYTPEGRKVNSPMELSNGGTYVAVIPPDPFIDTGYAKYLLKASRSWERRQQLLCGTIPPTKPDAAVAETIIEDEQENKGVHKENTLLVKRSPQGGQEERSILLTSNKALEAKGRPISIAKPNITKRALLSTSPKKSSIRAKNSTTKRMPKKTGIKSKTSGIVSKNNMNKKSVTATDDKIKAKSEKGVYESVSKESYKTVTLDKPSIEMDPAPSSATIPSIYKNQDIDTISVLVPVHSTKLITQVADDNKKEQDEIKNMIKEAVEKVTASSARDDEKRPSIIFSEKRPSVVLSEKQTSVALSEKSIGTFFTHINKGEIVSFKLQIDVKNAEGVSAVTNEKKEHVRNLHRSSQANLKVDIDNLSLPEQPDNATRKSSLQDIISDIYFQNYRGRPKVIVLKCPCCDYQYSVDDTQPLPSNKKGAQKIVIVMPVNTNASDSCGIYETDDKIKMGENSGSQFEEQPNQLQEKFNCCERLKNLGYDIYEHDEIDLQTIDFENPTSAVKFGDITTKKRSIDREDKTDASVVTDWCNMILELVVEDDSSFSFYLPSLETLRNYKL